MRTELRRPVFFGGANPARAAAFSTDRPAGFSRQSYPSEWVGHFLCIGMAASKCRQRPVLRILAQCSTGLPLFTGGLRKCYMNQPQGVPAMNQHAKLDTAASSKMSPEEWQARVDLAAVYRLCAHYGWDDIIYNHCSMRVPGEP